MTLTDNNFDDTIRGIATVLLAANDYGAILSALGVLFVLLSIVKLVLDIRYHPLNRKDDNGKANNRTDSDGGTQIV